MIRNIEHKDTKIQSFLFVIIISLCLCISVFELMSCSSEPKGLARMGKLPEIYPDYIGVTIPADIAPLNFNVKDDVFDRVDVVAFGSKGGEIRAKGKWADFDINEWHELTQQNQGGKITFTVRIERDGHWAQYDDFDVFVSNDRLDDWGLTYRRIKPGYEVGGDIGIYQRELSTFDGHPDGNGGARTLFQLSYS